MKLARSLERRLERFVEGLAGKLFRGNFQPLELATRLVREADLAAVQGPAGPAVPNRYRVTLSPADVGENAPLGALGREMAEVVAATAAERGWRLEGPVQVILGVSPEVSGGGVRCELETAAGLLPAWGYLVDTEGANDLPIRHTREVVGRSAEADLHIADDRVSRRHALIWREAGGVWITDLGSANGTAVNGVAATDVVALEDGDHVTIGPARYTFHRA